MIIWTSKKLQDVLKVDVPSDINSNIVQFNSKDVKPGDLFIALKGNGDGHDYVTDAIENRNAAVAIVHQEKYRKKYPDKTILVKDTYQALIKLAGYKRLRSKAKFIAITGSIGKTTTKSILGFFLSRISNCFVSRGNFNNYLGVAINLASISLDAEYAVFEIGMNNPGEIAVLSKFIKPDIAIITNIEPVHLGNFNSINEIAYEKSEIFSYMGNNGIAILNINNSYFKLLQSKFLQGKNRKIFSFGFSKNADATISQYEVKNAKSKIILSIMKQNLIINTFLIGKHNAINILSASLAFYILTKKLEISSIENFKPLKGRGQVLNIRSNKVILIDESYNASPEATKSALMNLTYYSNIKRKIAILGDMLELGDKEIYYHKELANYIKVNKLVTKVITVGKLSAFTYNKLPLKLRMHHFDTTTLLLEKINEIINDGDLILCKASFGMKFNNIISYLTSYY